MPAPVQRPVDPSVWVALLAAPLVAAQCEKLVRKHRGAPRYTGSWRLEASLLGAQGEPAGGSPGGSSSSSAREEHGSDSSSGSSDGSSSSSDGSEVEGEAGGGALDEALGPDRRQLLAWLRREEAVRQRYLEQYGLVVAEVLESMQQVSRAMLGRSL